MIDAVGIQVALRPLPRSAAPSPPPDADEPSPVPGRARTTDVSESRRTPWKGEPARPSTPSAPPNLAAARTSRPVFSLPAEKSTSIVAGAARTAGRAPLLERIVAAASPAPELQGNRVILALRSPEWGTLRIELRVGGSQVDVAVLAPDGAAREALVSQVDDLRARLEGRGLRLGTFTVATGEEPSPEEDLRAGPTSLRRHLLDVRA